MEREEIEKLALIEFPVKMMENTQKEMIDVNKRDRTIWIVGFEKRQSLSKGEEAEKSKYIESQNKMLDKMGGSLIKFQSEIAELKETLTYWIDESRDKTTKIRDLESNLAEKDKELEKYKSVNISIRGLFSNEISLRADAENKADELESENKELKAEQVNYNKTVDNLKDVNSNLREQIGELQREIEKLKDVPSDEYLDPEKN
ncbi:MAG TPA: hypothetical protein ACFYEK_01225 [Candidatus Wunengus sp. YC60]|uniref:hypothetical protein n=1 Tax=Candidatus Wunengus sp. YC60 TaxID=3367697 RepID=UPI0040265AF8